MLRRFFRRYLANTKLMFVRTCFKFSVQATHLTLAAFVPRSSSGGAGPSTTASSKSTRLRIALGRRARRGAEGSPFLSYSVAPSRLEGGGEESCCNGEAPAETPGRTRDTDGERGAGVSTAVEGALEGPSAPEAASAAPSRLEGDQAAEREEKPARGAANDCGGEEPARAGPVAATPRRAIGQIAPRGAEGLPLQSAALSRLEIVAGVTTALDIALEGPSAPEATSATPSLLEGDQAGERERESQHGERPASAGKRGPRGHSQR